MLPKILNFMGIFYLAYCYEQTFKFLFVNLPAFDTWLGYPYLLDIAKPLFKGTCHDIVDLFFLINGVLHNEKHENRNRKFFRYNNCIRFISVKG